MSHTVLAGASVANALTQGLHPPSGAGGNVFTWVTNLATDAKTAALAVGGLLAVVLIVWAAIKARGAAAGIVTGFLAAVLFVWGMTNVDSVGVQNKVGNTVNGLGPVVTQVTDPAPGRGPA